MKVLIVSDMQHMGGTEVATLITAKSLKQANINVTVLGKYGPLCEEIKKNHIEYINIDTHPIGIFNHLKLFYFFIKILKKDYTIVHAQMARPIPLIWLASKVIRSNIKVFWTSRGLKHQTYRYIGKFFPLMNIKGIGNCKSEQDKLIKYGFLKENTGYAYNPYRLEVTSEYNSFSRKKITIGMLTSLRRGRNVSLFFNVAKQLVDIYGTENIEFIIAGDGDNRGNYENLVVKMGIEKNCLFLGNVTNIEEYFENLDIFVSALIVKGDRGAGVSNAIVEAMLMRTPVCAFDAAAIGEIVINNQTGYLVESGNVDAMIEAIKNIVDDKNKTEQYVDNAYNLILSECDPEKYAQRLISLYKEL